MARLIFKYATMGAGKTLNILATAHQFKNNGITYQLLKPSLDTRTNGTIRSRIGIEEKCTVLPHKEDIWKYVDLNVKWLFIDEAQFLTSFQVEQLSYIVDEFDINVVCYGLRTDYQTHLFEGSKRLFEIADSFEELPSYCECGNKTSVNARLNNDGEIDVTDGEQIKIGGDNEYKALCRKCFNEKNNKNFI